MATFPSPARGALALTILVGPALVGGGCGSEVPGFQAVGGAPTAKEIEPGGAPGEAGADSGGGSATSGSANDAGKGGASRAGQSGSSSQAGKGGSSPEGGKDGAAGRESDGGKGASGGSVDGGKAGTGGATAGGNGGADDPLPEGCKPASYQGHRYAFCGVAASAEAARLQCEALGMTLVGIESAGENEFVATTAEGDSWLGGSDHEQQQRWVWTGTGVVFWNEGPVAGAYENFLPNNPNDNGPSGATEDCLVLFPGSEGQWNDLTCDYPFYRATCESQKR